MKNTEKTMDKLVALCKGRGFIYPGSEIYGGLANTWDFGPLGVELKNNIKWIIPNAQKNRMEPILLTLEAGGETYPDTPHEGEEFGYVLQGTVTIHLGGNTYRAKKGESFYYTADKQHRLSSKSGATLIWISSPPNF